MLAIAGLVTISAVLGAILSKRMSPLMALIAFPVVAALVCGFGWRTGEFVVAGVRGIAPIAGMFVFAILYFGLMTDAGMMEPVVSRVLKAAGNKPTRIAVATALLAAIAHLDGSGAVTFLITIPAMLPLYDRLGMDRRVLACCAAMAAGVNFLPWSGPAVRAAAALHVPVTSLFVPLIPVQLVGFGYVFAVAWWLGRREERRLARLSGASSAGLESADPLDSRKPAALPRHFVPNVLLTLAVMGVMVTGKVEPVVAFMIATVIALLMNYPDLKQQRERIDAHAKAALMMLTVLFAAGAFTGVMKETGMLTAMAQGGAALMPSALARRLPFVMGLLSMPLSLVFDPDSFYFGVLPVVAGVAQGVGVQPLQVGQAALLGQMTVGFPVSPLTPATYLLVGMAGIELSEHQRFAIPLLLGASVVMTFAAVAFGVFAL